MINVCSTAGCCLTVAAMLCAAACGSGSLSNGSRIGAPHATFIPEKGLATKANWGSAKFSIAREGSSAVQSWNHFSKSVAAGRNALFSPLIYELVNLLRMNEKPSADLLAACSEPYYPNSRIVVNDLEFINMALPTRRAPGKNCRFVRSIQPGKPRIVSLATFNNGWIGAPENADPAPFFSPGRTYHVPMFRWTDIFSVYNYGNVTTIQLPVRYQRWVAIMFLGTHLRAESVRSAALEVATHDRLQDGFERHFVRGTLNIPRFTLADQSTICVMRCETEKPLNASVEPRLEVTKDGIGLPLQIPKDLERYEPLPNPSIPPLSLTFDRPFYFAIVDRVTQTVLFIGYVARPGLL